MSSQSQGQTRNKGSGYRGRFAPSPTGPLHFGSLVAATGSYLRARAAGGKWFVRMEDVDPLREAPGAADGILRTLEEYGFEWDGEVMFQSRRRAAYEAALDRLRDRDMLYACSCTRREIADSSVRGVDGLVYPGTCREKVIPGRSQYALRVKTHRAGTLAFRDGLQGEQRFDLEKEFGDFVVRRADDLIAYQLACVVDDAEQGITEVVRGADLLTSTPRQICLQRLLGYVSPDYVHLPLAVNAQQEKLSKQTFAKPVRDDDRAAVLRAVLAFLGQEIPDTPVNLRECWQVATARWQLEKVPTVTTRLVPEGL